MPHFYVLRANREAGPFTPAELKAYGLLATDLLWVDGESKEWKHPADVEAPEMPLLPQTTGERGVLKKVISVASTAPDLSQKSAGVGNASLKETDAGSYTHQSKTFFRRNEKRNTVPYTAGTHLFGAAVLLIGLALCGFVVVNMMKQLDTKPAAASEAVEIHAEALSVSNTAHTAEAPQTGRPLSLAPVAQKKDTLLREITLPAKPLKTPASTNLSKGKNPNKIIATTQAARTDDRNETVAPESTEERPEPPKPVRQPPSLQLSANEYKVGLFGGVSNLEITVVNPSDQSVAKAVVEIEYLKPNGNVVRTQTVTAENLAGGSSKTVAVPSSGRGVKVRYRVVSVE